METTPTTSVLLFLMTARSRFLSTTTAGSFLLLNSRHTSVSSHTLQSKNERRDEEIRLTDRSASVTPSTMIAMKTSNSGGAICRRSRCEDERTKLLKVMMMMMMFLLVILQRLKIKVKAGED